jgi:HEPN domain-containing protein
MSSMSLIEVMQKRSRKFYEYALRALERGDYDMVMFMYEQAAQLRLKALLLRILGFTPRSHQLREFLGT